MSRPATAKLALALAATCALVVSVTAGAFAQGQTIDIKTKVKLRSSAPIFHGKVLANNEACVQSRKVKMYRRPVGGGAKKPMGKTTAADNGKWKVPVNIPNEPEPQNYFAVAPKVVQGTAGTICKCLKGKSKKTLIQ